MGDGRGRRMEIETDKSYRTTVTVQPGSQCLQDIVSCHSDLLKASFPFIAASCCLFERRVCQNLHPSASLNIFINVNTYANTVRSYIQHNISH